MKGIFEKCKTCLCEYCQEHMEGYCHSCDTCIEGCNRIKDVDDCDDYIDYGYDWF